MLQAIFALEVVANKNSLQIRTLRRVQTRFYALNVKLTLACARQSHSRMSGVGRGSSIVGNRCTLERPINRFRPF